MAITIRARTAEELASYASSKRRSVVDGGTTVVVGGIEIPTWADADTQSALTGLVVASQANPALVTVWRGRNGNFYQIDAAGIFELATGVMTFVQMAFATEAEAKAAISQGAVTSVAQIDAFAWPS